MENHNRLYHRIGKIGTITLLVLAALAITAGIILGEHFTVLQKATLICLECIGLG
jgi:hypothetical protein